MTILHSEQLAELASALAKAQGAFKAIKKEAENPYFHSRYADLSSLIAGSRKPLADNGLAVVQVPSAQGATVSMTTMLLHSSGQWISGLCSGQAKSPDLQAIGSAISYLRRYNYGAFLGLTTEDDDGEEAVREKPKAAQDVYTSTNVAAKKWLHKTLVDNKVPSKYWKEIAAELEGKPAEAMDEILRMIGTEADQGRSPQYEVVDNRKDPRQESVF